MVVSVPWRIKDLVLDRLRLLACCLPCPRQDWGLSWPRTMPRLLCPLPCLSFCNFFKSLPSTGPRPPLTSSQFFWSQRCSSLQGLRRRPGRVGGGIVCLGFSVETNSFSQAPGWVGCAPGAMGQHPAGWHKGPSSKGPTVEHICPREI